jgi:hypothetical protein
MGMSNTRIFWIIWCSAWAVFWFLLGWFFFPAWIFVPVSLLCILIPVGNGSATAAVGVQPVWPQQQTPSPPPGYGQWSEDGQYWWDGTRWVAKN